MAADLVERGAECAALDALLDDVAAGRGGLAVITGPAGIGKSALLGWLTARCAAVATPVLAARATELGGAVAFGLARRLLEPAVRSHPTIVTSGWAKRCRPLFAGEQPGPGVSAPIVEGLVEAVANLVQRDRPSIVVVDDAQWGDSASLSFLLELAERRAEVGVGIAVAVNSGEPPVDGPALGRLQAIAGSAVMEPGSLSPAAVRELAGARSGPRTAGFAERLARITGGNPLLVTQLLEAADLGDGDELVLPHGLEKLVALRLQKVSPAARALAKALAVLGEAPLRLAAELAGLDDAAADAAADALVTRRLVAAGERLRFEQPILAEALLASVPPFELAAAHRRAAELLAGDGADDEQLATHLVRSRAAGDGWTCDVLRAASRASLGHGDPAHAVRLLERAMDEPPPPQQRPAVALDLARARAAAGQPEAIPEFEAALRHLSDPAERAEAWHQLSRLLYARGDYVQASAAAGRGLAELPDDHPQHERLLADELLADVFIPERMAAAWARTDALAGGAEPPTDPTLLAYLIVQSSWRGRNVDRLPALARAAVADDPLIDPQSGGRALNYVAGALNMIDATPLSCRLLDAGLERAGALGDPLAEASLRCCRAWARIHQGRLAAAGEDLDAVRETSGLGWPAVAALAGPPAVVLRLERGDIDGARAALHGLDTGPLVPGLSWFAGAIAMATGDHRRALEAFERAGEELEGELAVGNPGVLPWRASAALAAAHLGDRQRARNLLEPAIERATALGIPEALGIALRVSGFVEGDLDQLQESVDVLHESSARLELARSLLYLGMGRRRARQAREARGPLTGAEELARECGATVVAERAARELRAAGGRSRRRPRVGVRALTAGERNVAELAARGLTTRQIAAQLYLTPKTVEGHLTRIYRKLDVSSRRELEGKLTAGADRLSASLDGP